MAVPVDESSGGTRGDRAPLRAATLLGITGFVLALAAAIAALAAGAGHRLEWWDFRTGFLILRMAAWAGTAAAALSAFALIIALRGRARRAVVYGVDGLILGALVFGVPWYLVTQGRSLPAIHDITTDTVRPPEFIGVLPLRKDAPNSAQHAGAEIAKQQRAAYPDIVPRVLNMAPEAAYERALTAARDSGWDIVAAVPAEGRIEATATTLMFGFKDDVVVRITPVNGGSRIDVRSVSRIGRSDLGTNARRIRDFLERLTPGQG